MSDISEVLELLDQMCGDYSIPKNVRTVLIKIRDKLREEGDIRLRVNSAIENIEELGLDPNLSPYAREQIWNLTSMLSSLAD